MDTINKQNISATDEKAREVRPNERTCTAKPQADKGQKVAGTKNQANDRSSTKNTKPVTKAAKVLKLLHSKNGASIKQLEAVTGWQAHSVRGFLSGTVKKKLGITVASEVGKDGVRRYCVTENAKAG